MLFSQSAQNCSQKTFYEVIKIDEYFLMNTKVQKSNKLYLSLHKAYVRFLKIRGNPREIALGLALGLFVGMTPFMGFHTAIAVFFAALFKWNKISAAIGVWVTNPVTAPVIYSITYFTGSKLFGPTKAACLANDLSFSAIVKILQKTPEIFLVLSIGGVIVGLPLAVFGYYFSYSAVHKYQEGIRKKLAKAKEKRARKKKTKGSRY